MKVIPEPEGTRGYDDLRRAATREYLGKGVRSPIASVGDPRPHDLRPRPRRRHPQTDAMRRIAELDVGRGLEL